MPQLPFDPIVTRSPDGSCWMAASPPGEAPAWSVVGETQEQAQTRYSARQRWQAFLAGARYPGRSQPGIQYVLESAGGAPLVEPGEDGALTVSLSAEDAERLVLLLAAGEWALGADDWAADPGERN